MAWIAGLATEKEIAELTRRGWVVERAEDHGLVGDNRLIEQDDEASPFRPIVVYVDSNVFAIMNGVDWEGHDPTWEEVNGTD
jgi:hypothetical protein